MKKSNELYYYKLSCKTVEKKKNIVNPITIIIFKPSLFKLKVHESGVIIYIFWYVITYGRYRIYYVKDNRDNVIHYSHILPKFFKFPFMCKYDIEIGPCWTHEKYRGQNIYPTVLAYIVNTLWEERRTFYIMTNGDNIHSQKGIVKAGFTFFAKGYKNGFFGIYKMKNSCIKII